MTDQETTNQIASSLSTAIISDINTAPPSLSEFEAAIPAVNNPAAPPSGLRALQDASGNIVATGTTSGVTAAAFVDDAGNLIITYQGTTSMNQLDLDLQIAQANTAAPGLTDAVAFYNQAVAIAHAQGIAVNSTPYVTGHSLGGSLSSYVASQTGAAGIAFATSGVPGYVRASTPANFISVLNKGDPWAQAGTDSGERSVMRLNPKLSDHYGTVVQFGDAAGDAQIKDLVKLAGRYTPGQLISLAGGNAQATEAVSTFQNDMGSTHPLEVYEENFTAIPTKVTGLQSYTTPAMLADIAHYGSRLTADLPNIFAAAATSPAAAATVFTRDFPVLSRDLVMITHAPTVGAAINDIASTVGGTSAFTAYPQIAQAAITAAIGNLMTYATDNMADAGHAGLLLANS